MASVVLRSAGSAIGNALLPGLGGAVLGTLGQGLGGLVDGKLGLGTHIEGARLENLSVQDSRYGAGIPLVFGRVRVAGNIIWSSDLIETQHDSSYAGGKGGGSSVSSTTYSYSVHCAVGLALGPIGGINTIWADSKVIYQDGVWATGIVDAATIYTGTMTQAPDPFMQSWLGSGNVPAYRGLAYIVFDNLQLANFGNRLPNLTFEIYPADAASSAPQLFDTMDAGVNQFQPVAQNGSMKPIVLERSGSDVQRVLVGGYAASGSNYVFEVVDYDVTDTIPVEQNRVQSASFGTTIPYDCAWAVAPDGRYVAFCLQRSAAPNHVLVLYDSVTQSFGSQITLNLTAAASNVQVAWLDPLHIVIMDISGTQRGVRVLARAGLGLIDLGFFNVWGAGTASSRFALYAAQFTPYAGGLLHYVADNLTGSYVTNIYAVALSWRNNSVAVGSPYTVVSGLITGTGSNPHANLVRTSHDEWTLCFGTVLDYYLLSFVPSVTGASITRPWQRFVPSFGMATTHCPVAYGTRLVLVQRAASENNYRLSEINLNAGGFALAIDAAVVSGAVASVTSFTALRLDSLRLLLAGVGGFTASVMQFGVMERSKSGRDLASLVAALLQAAGYTAADYDVSALDGTVEGYVLQPPLTARAALEPLQVYAPFDLVESAGVLKAVPRNSVPSVTLTPAELRATHEGQALPPYRAITRAQELDLPLAVNVDYIDAGRDFEVNSQQARRMTSAARSIQKVNLPIVAGASVMKRVAETRLYTMWAERELVRVTLSRRYLALDPGDVIDLGDGSLLRITRLTQTGGLISAEGFYVTTAAGSSTATADSGLADSAATIAVQDSALLLLDIPLLQASDDQAGFYATVSGLDGWTAATLWRSGDAVNYAKVANLGTAATMGIATTTLADGTTCYQDNASSVTVQLLHGSLSSCTQSDLLNGANAACLGGEIIQFQNATLLAAGLYQLTGLLRGRRGTESATSSHSVGENFVLLTPQAVTFIPGALSDRGRPYQFRALTNGQSLGDAQDYLFSSSLATIKPLAPVNITGTRASGTGSDLTLVWKRRARLHAEWVDLIDVPLDESSELYDAEIMNGSTVMRTFSNLTVSTFVYSAAQQSADWGGSIPAILSVRIYQLSSRYGRGAVASASV